MNTKWSWRSRSKQPSDSHFAFWQPAWNLIWKATASGMHTASSAKSEQLPKIPQLQLPPPRVLANSPHGHHDCTQEASSPESGGDAVNCRRRVVHCLRRYHPWHLFVDQPLHRSCQTLLRHRPRRPPLLLATDTATTHQCTYYHHIVRRRQ